MTQPEKRETQQCVSLTAKRVFSGRVCELCVWETLSYLFFSPLHKALTILWIMLRDICITSCCDAWPGDWD